MKSFVEELYVQKSRQIFATLIRLVGDFELAEESMHEAFTVALQNWSESGIPTNPQAWLISTARHKAIDQLRRKKGRRCIKKEQSSSYYYYYLL